MTIEPLTSTERERFASWLEADSVSDRLIALELTKMKSPMAPVRFADYDAKVRVARILRETESM